MYRFLIVVFTDILAIGETASTYSDIRFSLPIGNGCYPEHVDKITNRSCNGVYVDFMNIRYDNSGVLMNVYTRWT